MGTELQQVDNDSHAGMDGSAPLEPVYFMLGFIAGILFISLFKGRWFL